MRTVISVSLADDMAKSLEKEAKRSGRSKSGVVKEALREYLWEERFRRLRGKMVRGAESRGVLTDEDVFKAVS
jgi:metal-responsive CopG/Arc/MetJ family transcriptional regulator